MRLILFLFLFSSSLMAQTLGNPGGGGPDEGSPEQLCLNHQKRIEKLEERFLRYWHKSTKNPGQNLEILNEIEVEILISNIMQFTVNDKFEFGPCLSTDKKITPFNRTHFNEELKLLDELILDLENNIILKDCHYFPEENRRLHLERLISIRRFYGK